MMNRHWKILSSISLVGAVALVATGCSSPGDTADGDTATTHQWRYETTSGTSDRLTTYWESTFLEGLPASIETDVYNTDSLFPAAERAQAIGDGLLQAGEVGGSQFAGEYELADVGDLPFLIPWDPTLRRQVIEDVLKPKWAADLEADHNLKLLAVIQAEPRSIYSRVPIESLADLDGIKLRAIAGIESQVGTAFGAVETSVAFGEVYQAMQTGVLDAFWVTHAAMIAPKLYEVSDYIYEVGSGGAMLMIVANLDSYNELSDAEKDEVEAAATASEDNWWSNVDKVYNDARDQLTDEFDMSLTTISDSDYDKMADVAEGLREDYAAGKSDEYRDLLEQVEKKVAELS